MNKPIVFFSHSSIDGQVITRLKEMILQKTGKSFDVFTSSDGQSINFGTNWVHKIEKALRECILMFVFISPDSLRSHWIFFESGFAYAKQKVVVPVGIRGFDLQELPPPLGLLQGFNFTSEDGLNNIIARINHTFNHTHDECFTQSDYDKLFSFEGTVAHSLFGRYTIYVDEISFWLKEESLSIEPKEVIPHIKSKLKEDGIDCGNHSETLFTYGLSFGWDRSSYPASFVIRLAPNLAKIGLQILDELLPRILKQDVSTTSFEIVFGPNVGYLKELFKISSLLYHTAVTIKNKNIFSYDNIDFRIDKYWKNPEKKYPAFIEANYKGKSLSELRLYELIHELFDNHILFFDRRS